MSYCDPPPHRKLQLSFRHFLSLFWSHRTSHHLRNSNPFCGEEGVWNFSRTEHVINNIPECYLDLQPPLMGSSHCGRPGTLKTWVMSRQTDLAYHLKQTRNAMIKVEKRKTCTMFLLSYRNTSESLGEQEML